MHASARFAMALQKLVFGVIPVVCQSVLLNWTVVLVDERLSKRMVIIAVQFPGKVGHEIEACVGQSKRNIGNFSRCVQ